MRRMLVMGLAAFAAGWTSPAGAETFAAAGPVPAILPVTGPIARAPEAAPDAMLNAATLEVTASLRQDTNLQTDSPGRLAELVESTILPLFNFHHMTRLALARDWRLASPEQQNALIAEFRTLLLRTYSSTLADHRDQAIEYKPLRIAPGVTVVTVKSSVKQPGAERMTIDYDMEKMTAGWTVYDIKIGGISLITTYRSTFAQSIRDGGVDGLIKSLSARNRQANAVLRFHESGARPYLFIYTVIPSVFRGGR